MDNSKNTALNVYRILRRAGMTHAGAIAVLGNAQAESMLTACRIQGDLSLSATKSVDYTAKVDSGEISADDFIYRGPNGGGYGLLQWTLQSRKLSLYRWCKNSPNPASIGDETAQTEFCVRELQVDFPRLWELLCTTDDYQTACDLVCNTYERPAVNNYSERRAYASEFDYLKDDFAEDISAPVKHAAGVKDQSVMHLQAVLACNGYWDKPIDGLRSIELCDKLAEFAKDLKKYI